MSDLKTPTVPISMIDVDPDSNVRTHIDEKKLKGLVLTVEAVGITQPVQVRPKENGRFELIAGERRYLAAKRAGLKEVPITIGEGNAHLNKVIENLQREDLDPIDTARALRMLKGELNLTTNKRLADRTGMDAGWIGGHLRLRGLPEGVQRYVAEGAVPIDAERLLREIAEGSPKVAECICELAKRRKYKGRYFIEHFDEIFAATAGEKFKDKPTMISVRRPKLSTVVRGKKRRDKLAERIDALQFPYRQGLDPAVPLSEVEVDAARALGCLVEHTNERNGMVATTAFITDASVAADLVERAVERWEKEVAERIEGEAAQKAVAKKLSDPEKDARKAKREEAKERQVAAEVFNEDLSGKQFKVRTPANRKQRSLARFKAVAAVLVADNPKLAGRGLRLVLPALQNVEAKELKSGKPSTKVTYADSQQCTAELLRRIDAAASVEEGLEVLAEAFVAAELADDEQLPQSKRIYWSPPRDAEKALKKHLSTDIKAVRPRRRRPATK
jgi:ParB family chromosome partitioning protein